MVTTTPHFSPVIESLRVRQVSLAQKSINFHIIGDSGASVFWKPLVELFLLMALKLTSSARKASTRS